MSVVKYRDRKGGELTTDEGKEPPPPPKPCQRCNATTAQATLAMHGAMCLACYHRYCCERHPVPHLADKRTDGPRAWACALQAQEESGERLTPAVKLMWRAAIQQREAA